MESLWSKRFFLQPIRIVLSEMLQVCVIAECWPWLCIKKTTSTSFGPAANDLCPPLSLYDPPQQWFFKLSPLRMKSSKTERCNTSSKPVLSDCITRLLLQTGLTKMGQGLVIIQNSHAYAFSALHGLTGYLFFGRTKCFSSQLDAMIMRYKSL